ncbi:MAG: transposase domain-containing protein [Myxococcales bacterium]
MAFLIPSGIQPDNLPHATRDGSPKPPEVDHSETAAEDGRTNATFVSLLASCQLHGIEPHAYLRDLFCLLPGWPVKRVMELAPANWKKTLEDKDAQQRLAANVFRKVSLGELVEHPSTR